MAGAEEYVAYNESSPGFLLPIIAIQRANGTSSFRDMTREDLSRIPDDFSSPGGWIFKKSNTSNTWSRRFAMLRGAFMFYFRSPQAERPVGIIPLTDCEVGLPSDPQAASTEGFEFEIRNFLGHTVRMYALSGGERDSWITACQERIDCYRSVAAPLVVSLPPAPGQAANTCNIFITPCQLSEDRNARPAPPPPGGPVIMGYVNPLQAPSLSPGKDFPPPAPAPMDQYNYHPPVAPPPPQTPPSAPQSQQSLSVADLTPPAAEPMVIMSGHSLSHQQPAPPPPPAPTEASSNAPFAYPGLDTAAASDVLEGSYGDSAPPLSEDVRESLEHGLQNKFSVQQEAAQREARAHERYTNQQFLQAERELEARNPLRLAELFRMMLFFVNEELIIDPQPEARVQIPHVKGIWAENMLVCVYQHYCNRETGFMSLEELVFFLEDSAILKTHTPHDEDDEPLAEFKALLEPQELLSSIPRGLGSAEGGGRGVESAYLAPNNARVITQSRQESENAARRTNTRRMSTTTAAFSQSQEQADGAEATDDAFLISFTHFYDILLRITEVVYPELWGEDRTVAMNKLLQESILPLYAWTQEHSKIGSDDVLVREERIPLLLITYAPNLWKVFLLYAQDVNAKIPELDLPYPQCAQDVEKQLFGVPKGAPVKAATASDPRRTEPFIMTQAAVLRVCTDYGFIPHLISKEEVKQLVQKLNGEKVLRKPKQPVSQTQMGYATSKSSLVRARYVIEQQEVLVLLSC